MLESLTQKQKIVFFIILLIMLLIIIYYIYSVIYNTDHILSFTDDSLIDSTFIENNSNIISNTEDLESGYIIVYVCGAVKENKIVKLKENSRINDAIDAVGGLTKNADLTAINLAYILEDGEKIYIPEKGEGNENNSNFSSSNNSSYINNQKININKASQTELETIPGIGPSLALKIINYREEHSKFSSIEDIKNVSGIGENKFESIKELICVYNK